MYCIFIIRFIINCVLLLLFIFATPTIHVYLLASSSDPFGRECHICIQRAIDCIRFASPNPLAMPKP